MKKLNLIFTALTIFYCQTRLLAQSDTVKYNNHVLVSNQLKLGLTKYLVYSEDSATQTKSGISIWERNVFFKKLKNRELIIIHQNWLGLDSINSKREIISHMDAKSFLPIYHYTLSTASRGRRRTEAFVFEKDSIKAPDSSNINNKTFGIAIDQPVFNWEMDLETFAQLPLKTGKTFVIPFYHPGSKTLPAYYTYKVEGEDKIPGLQYTLINCWRLIYRDERSTNYSIWWLNKKTHTVVKMKEYYNGKFRYKLLMNV